jgi:hypothetical protein
MTLRAPIRISMTYRSHWVGINMLVYYCLVPGLSNMVVTQGQGRKSTESAEQAEGLGVARKVFERIPRDGFIYDRE